MKLSDKLTKVNDNFTIYMYDNGYMIEVGGYDSNNNWCTAKILCQEIDQLVERIKEATAMERD